MIFLIFEFQPCISLSFDNWQNKSQEKKNISHLKRDIFCRFMFYHSKENHFRLDERLRKWPFSAKISLQLQGLIMWCFLVLGHCDKIHLRVEGVFCPVSISVPMHNCLKQFLKDYFYECSNSARDISALSFCLPRFFDPCTFWLLGLSSIWNFDVGTFWNLGCFGAGTLFHWDISALGYFSTMDVRAWGNYGLL